MDAKFVNGSVVNRIWRDQKTELVACFQYERDALAFAYFKAAQDAKDELHTSYAVACTYSGQLTIVKLPLQDGEEAK